VIILQELEKHKLELLARIDERTKSMEEKISRMDKVIYGNGKEGLCDRVDKIETQHITVDKVRAENWKMIGIILAAFSVIVALLNYFKI
jgi:3-phenylpropionate/cinnamic acid dioxygenase small subunit